MKLLLTCSFVLLAFASLIQAQEISVRGGPGLDVFIANEDDEPREADGTAFGSTNVTGGAVERTFRIRNLQSSDGFPFTGDLTVGISENSSHFSITAAPILPIGEESFADFTVRFDPTSTGNKTATIKIDNNDPDGGENPYTFKVSGRGVGVPEIEVFGLPLGLFDGTAISDGDTSPRSQDGTHFGTVDALAADKENFFRIRNTGTGTLTVSASDASPHFRVVGMTSSVAPGAIHDFRVRFDPQQSGTLTGNITLTNNDANENPFTFRVRGVARAPEIQVQGGVPTPNTGISSGDMTPRVADGTEFGNRELTDGPRSHTFRISNLQSSDGIPFTGDLTVNITDDSSQFSIGAAPLLPIGEGSSATFTVLFDPSVEGEHVATIRIDNNDPDGNEDPFTFRVRGTGVGEPEIQVFGLPNLISDGIQIFDGDTTPRPEDGTNFGTVDALALLDKTNAFRVRNTGSAPLTVSLSDNSTQFVTAGLVSSIAPGALDDFTIRFNPNASGPHTATVTITNNDANENPFTFNIRGVARAPEISVRGGADLNTNINSGDITPSVVDGTDFGEANVTGGAVERTFRIRNLQSSDGFPFTGDLTVAITENSPHFAIIVGPILPIGEGAFADFTVRYDPQAVGNHRATVTIDNNDPDGDEDPFTFRIRGVGLGTPEIAVFGLPNLLSDGTAIADGDTNPRTADGTNFGTVDALFPLDKFNSFRVKNTGTAPLTVSLSEDSPHYDVTEGLITSIPVGGFDDFTITFDPLASGRQDATVTIVNNDEDENPYTFAITGVARAPEIQVRGGAAFDEDINSGDITPATIDNTDFGSTNVSGGAIENTFRIFNLQDSDGIPLTGSLTVLGISVDNPNFSITSPPFGIFPLLIEEEAFGVFTVRFDPVAPGAQTATVTINHNDPDGVERPYRFNITGTADRAELSLLGGSDLSEAILDGDTSPMTSDGTDFGTLDLGMNSMISRTFLLKNNGNVPLTFSIPVQSREFEFSDRTGAIEGGESQSLTISYQPDEVGLNQLIVRIVSNDVSNQAFTFRIRGEAVGPAIGVTDFNQNFSIPNGNLTTSVLDGTDLGEIEIGSTGNSLVRILNGGSTPLTFSLVENSPDFSLLPQQEGAIASGDSVGLGIIFEPTSAGEKNLTVRIESNDPELPVYTFRVSGVGLAPQQGSGLEGEISSFVFTETEKALTFNAVAGKRYKIMTSTNLKDWEEMSEQDAIDGAGNPVTVDLGGFISSSLQSQCYFRVEELN